MVLCMVRNFRILSSPPEGRGGAQSGFQGAACVVAKLECEGFFPAGRPSCLPGRVDGEVGTATTVSWKCQAPGRCEQLTHVQSALWPSSPGADKGKHWSSGEGSFWRWSQRPGIQPWLCLSRARQSLRTFFTSRNNFIICKMERTQV